LGISTIFLPCEALRNYFYRLRGAAGQNHQPNFYEAFAYPGKCFPRGASSRLQATHSGIEYRVRWRRATARASLQHPRTARTTGML
jgi:hypothetical protein